MVNHIKNISIWVMLSCWNISLYGPVVWAKAFRSCVGLTPALAIVNLLYLRLWLTKLVICVLILIIVLQGDLCSNVDTWRQTQNNIFLFLYGQEPRIVFDVHERAVAKQMWRHQAKMWSLKYFHVNLYKIICQKHENRHFLFNILCGNFVRDSHIKA